MAAKDIQTAADLWDGIVTRAGLDLKSYDAPLIEELAKALSISSRNFRTQLVETDVSVESLLQNLLRLLAPYARMMNDLLAFFARAGAKASADNLRIEFDFSKREKPLDFDLENFREWERRWRQGTALISFDRLDWMRAGELRHLFIKAGTTYTVGDGQWRAVSPATVGDGNRRVLPPPPSTDDPELSAYLQRVWAFLQACLDQSLWAGDAPLQPDGVWSIVRGAHLLHTDRDRLLPKLREIFTGAEQSTRPIPAVIEELFELLNLPIWKRRSDLYSAWVGTRVIDVYGDDARVHVVDRKIVFSFKGTHLATVRLRDGNNLAIWCEVRAPARNLLGKGRSKAIQPDFVVKADPASDPNSTVLVVECKQYLRQSVKNFSEAIVDYARTHRNAKVVLVNYGPVTEAIQRQVETLDREIAPRTLAIGDLHPDSPRAVEKLTNVVRMLIPTTPALAASKSQSSSTWTGMARLTWTDDADLDLHCRIETRDGTQYYVDYRQQEWSDGNASIWLEEDVRTGGSSEILRWENLSDVHLEIAVHAFGDQQTIAAAGNARVELSVSNVQLHLEPPPAQSAPWWSLISLGSRQNELRVLNMLLEEVPWQTT